MVVAVLCTMAVMYRPRKALRGALLMYCTNNIRYDWPRFSIDINQRYARRHNYEFVLVTEPYDVSSTFYWQKIPLLLRQLDRGVDFVVYMDADSVINKPELRYERILEKYPGDLILCSDAANSDGKYAVNTGLVIVRNTPAAKKLLTQWWGLRNSYPDFAFEQFALSDIVRGKYPAIDGGIISVAPETTFNSVYGEMMAYINNATPRPDHFVLHFMATDSPTRERMLSALHRELMQGHRGIGKKK